MRFVSETVTRNIGRKLLVMRKNSPTIFFVGGIIGVVSSTVLACQATLKLEKTIDEVRNELESVKERHEIAKTFVERDVDEALEVVEPKLIKYNRPEYYKDLTLVYSKTIFKFGKLYGPSIAIGIVSIGSLTGSHVQLVRRNAALSSALAMVTKAYEEYRLKVQEEIGKERELDIYHGVTSKEVEVDGKTKVVKVKNEFGHSPYARCFDAFSVNWSKNAEENRFFIQCQQNYVNHQLKARGHVFLNEVYDLLGFERTKAGAVVGWLADGDVGDGYIDFGVGNPFNKNFLTGIEPSVWLDFNVDGVIYDKI